MPIRTWPSGRCWLRGWPVFETAFSFPPEIAVDPASLSAEELAGAGASRLPSSLPEALEHYESSAVLAEALGEPLHETIAAVRRAELALFAETSPSDIALATRWRH